MSKRTSAKPDAANSTNSTLKKDQLDFIVAFRQNGNIRKCADLVGIHRDTHYKWLRDCPDYVIAFAAARDDAADLLESEALRRAVEGTDKPIYYKGKRVDTIKEYSDVLLIVLLKANRPDKFRERFELEVKDVRERVETAIAEFMKRTGKPRDEAIEFLKPHIPQISELVH